jgi:hypothetical protein
MKKLILWPGAVCLLILSAAGCGGPANQPSLKGKVTYNGSPLPNALVTVTGADNNPIGGSSDGEGNYTVENVPLGAVTIKVMEPPERMMKGPAKPGLAKLAKKGGGIPFDVKPGAQTFDLVITD